VKGTSRQDQAAQSRLGILPAAVMSGSQVDIQKQPSPYQKQPNLTGPEAADRSSQGVEAILRSDPAQFTKLRDNGRMISLDGIGGLQPLDHQALAVSQPPPRFLRS
jgi:hypothetical protein